LKEETSPNQTLIHHFCILCQTISHIHHYKSDLFPEFATKYFHLHKDKLHSTLDVTFLTDAFTKMKINTRDIYKFIEKLINQKIVNLSLENCDQLLISAQRRYENFSMVFLSFLAARFDKLYLIQKNLEGLKAQKAVQIVNLMNIVRQKERTSKFDIYDNLVALIENENSNENAKKEEKSKEIKK